MEGSDICDISHNDAKKFLQEWSFHNGNIISEIENLLATWNYESETNLDYIQNDFTNIIQYISQNYFNHKDNTLPLYTNLHCVIFNLVYENVMPLIKMKLRKEDAHFNKRCRYIWKLKINPYKSSIMDLDALPFTSSVVELSMMDIYKSPIEKLKCLCLAYDLLYAELKSSLIGLISSYSERELEIPVVNDDEVVPVIAFILMRSKLLYFFSNIFCIKHFSAKILEENAYLRNILRNFEIASKEILNTDDEMLADNNNAVTSDISTTEVIEILTSICEKDNNDSANLKDEYQKRFLSLITLCTNASFIPTNH